MLHILKIILILVSDLTKCLFFEPNGTQFFVITQTNLILNTKYLHNLSYELITNYLSNRLLNVTRTQMF